jgi:enterochelin esterase family protein
MKALTLRLAGAIWAVASLATAAEPRAADPFAPVRFLIGGWTGEASGQPGKGTVERQYSLVLDNRFIEELNTSTYEARPGRQPEVHQHRSFLSYDQAQKKLMLRQFHVEGFVNHYAQNLEAGTATRLVFDSVAFENLPAGWKARETYELISADEFIEIFELAAPGKPLELYSRNHFRRKAASARPAPPTRAADGPLAPKWTVMNGAGSNAPVDAEGDFLIGPGYVPAPELTPVPGVPQGQVRQFLMKSADSSIYPRAIAREVFGTVDPDNHKTLIVQTHEKPWERAITVYIPAGYDGRKALPFIVSHDGPKMDEPDLSLPRILDNLISRKRVPAMAAVMIQNGGGDAQGHQRGLEYDTLSGRFAEFIETEVLPAVQKNYAVKLTRDPEGRAAMGCSSGAAAAFSMAWYHPEWYRRVISYSGTYVNQQWPFNPATPGGAWEYHASLIPNSPRKPIRIWMHVGDRDLFNPNVMRDGMHDWVEANHRMAAALKAKGYRYQYVYALDSTHCDRRVREQTLPQALEWLWRGYR